MARRVNRLVSKLTSKDLGEDQKPNPVEEVKEEIERCLNQIGAKEWLEMCFYDDYKFFVKLYPKLEELYRERFGESENSNKYNKDGKNIMANKMVRLGFPEEIETVVIKYVSIRNIFQHTMSDISTANLELARDAFAKVFVHLTLSCIESKLLFKNNGLKNREMLYANLTEFFSKRLAGNTAFCKIIIEELETAFQV